MSLEKSLAEKLRVFLHVNGFCNEEHRRLVALAPRLLPHLPEVTDAFYARLLGDPHTAAYIEGRVEQLKQTHLRWLEALLTSPVNRDFVEAQLRIGRTHVTARIPPLFVAASMSHLRSVTPALIEEEVGEHAGDVAGTVLKLLDLCQYLIDYAYEQDRLNRITCATGLSRPLLENLIALKRAS